MPDAKIDIQRCRWIHKCPGYDVDLNNLTIAKTTGCLGCQIQINTHFFIFFFESRQYDKFTDFTDVTDFCRDYRFCNLAILHETTLHKAHKILKNDTQIEARCTKIYSPSK